MKQYLFWFLVFVVVHENKVNTILVFFSSHKDDTITNSLGLYMYVGKKFYLIDGNIAMDPKDQEAEDLEAVEKVAH